MTSPSRHCPDWSPRSLPAFNESDYLQLSGLQHFAFCRRQWALIHIEQQWAENLRTAEGAVLHARAHDTSSRESRGAVKIARGMYIHSAELGISGQCDVVEFHRDESGVPIAGWEGKWRPFPVEYKRGAPKATDADRLQLCAQVMCLEEMLCCSVPRGALFYGETKRREIVDCTPELRAQVRKMLDEMHALYRRGHTPKVKPGKSCNACSLKPLCLPALMRQGSVDDYLRSSLEATK